VTTEFDTEESKALAESLAHRGELPREMCSRWDTQGAFIAGQRLMFEKMQFEIARLQMEIGKIKDLIK
jgi:hypothetical protein